MAKKLKAAEIREYVNANIGKFHEAKLKSLKTLNLDTILKKKNPYLFRAKNIALASDLVNELMSAFLSSSEEKLFGDFLEGLAIFVADKVYNGRKSAATGVDLEFDRDGMRYVVSVKSGASWGNSSQQRKLEEDLKTAVKVLKQSNHALNVQPVLGICYGKTKTSYVRNYMKVTGQNFWFLISGEKNLYTDIIEPLGYKAEERTKEFIKKRDNLMNEFTRDMIDRFCNGGEIDWRKVVEFNSGNFDLGNSA